VQRPLGAAAGAADGASAIAEAARMRRRLPRPCDQDSTVVNTRCLRSARRV